MSHQTYAIELTAEELGALVGWLAVIAFQGTAAALAEPLALHAGILAKLRAAHAAGLDAAPYPIAEHGVAPFDESALE